MHSRRARKSYDQWSALVVEYDSSTFTMEEFCQRNDLALSTFQRWRSTIHRADSVNVDAESGFTRITATTPLEAPSSVTLQIGRSITMTIHTTDAI